jgi:hypothetical protein
MEQALSEVSEHQTLCGLWLRYPLENVARSPSAFEMIEQFFRLRQ